MDRSTQRRQSVELFEPEGKPLAAVEYYEISHKCLPSLLSLVYVALSMANRDDPAMNTKHILVQSPNVVEEKFSEVGGYKRGSYMG